jgi:hypothetical protein
MLRQPNGEYRCRQHNIILHTPVSVYCKHIRLLENQDEEAQLWFEQYIEASDLAADTLYTWIETHLREGGKNKQARFDSLELTQIAIYLNWSAGQFWQSLRLLRQNQRNFYRQQGYEIDE